MTSTVLKDFPLYDPRNEHDACGIGFIVNVNAERSHDTIMKGIQILVNLAHRGASGSDPKTGDGAGITIQIPHKFFTRECGKLGFTLPPEGEYGVGMLFLPVEPQPRFECEAIIERIVQEEGLSMLGWRDTPVDADAIGRVARVSQPYIEQIFIRMRSRYDHVKNLNVNCISFGNEPNRKLLRRISRIKISFMFRRCLHGPLSIKDY